MKSLLPIIIVILTLTGAITYSLARKTAQVKKGANLFGISANNLVSDSVPSFKIDTDTTPAPTNTIVTPTVQPLATPTPTPTSQAELPETNEETVTTKGGEKVATVNKTITSTICTPVYGMADTCIENVVVDTGAEDSVLFNLAGISYVGGLAAFVKAKSKKK